MDSEARPPEVVVIAVVTGGDDLARLLNDLPGHPMVIGEREQPAGGATDCRRHGVLDMLSASPNRVFTRREILDRVWHVGPRFIRTVRGVGFRMAA